MYLMFTAAYVDFGNKFVSVCNLPLEYSTTKTVKIRRVLVSSVMRDFTGGGGVLPYMGYIGMCGPKGYGFSAVLVSHK